MFKIVLCGNAETVVDGYFAAPSSELLEEVNEVLDAGIEAVFLHDLDVRYDIDRTFQHWHGGKHYKAGSVIGDNTYGYQSGGWVATHEVNPPQWLCDLCDSVSDAMESKATELGELEDAKG